jgi:predicted CoA-binding protein
MTISQPVRSDVAPVNIMRELLTTSKVIAVVGASVDPHRPSFAIMAYLKRNGYRVLPVNPHEVGHMLHGEPFYASLGDIPEKVDLVNVFRRSDALEELVADAIAAEVPAIWMQLGVYNEHARATAQAAGLTVVMGRCISIEHARLMGR